MIASASRRVVDDSISANPVSACAAINLLGVKVNAINMTQALDVLDCALTNRRKGYVCVTGVHGIVEAQKDLLLRTIINCSLLTTPDGMPTVWIGKINGHKQMTRVCGPDLMPAVCSMSAKKGYKQFLYGGRHGVAQELKQVLVRRFPGLRVVGTYTPPFRPLVRREELELAAMVSKAKPDIFWVGLSTPKQEHFMARYIDKLDTTIMIGVGAAFDFHTGTIRAPEWMRPTGLEWLHRLYQEPRRLWKRYLFNNPRFISEVMLQLLHLKRYSLYPPSES